ncbi:hypothetical protein Tco_0808941 [Tanacetum coccineum]
MDDPNITMEEYIQLMADKAQKHGRTFDWQNATFGEVKCCEDEDDCFTNFEAMFPAIVFGNGIEDDDAISSRPTVGPPFETNPGTTMDEYENAFGKDFEMGFPTIVYNDVSTSNQNISSKPTVSIYNAIKSDIDFHISFSDSEDEDYTFIYNKDSSSYKLTPINDLKLEPVNNYVENNIESCSENIDVKPMDSVICISKDITPVEFDENFETNHDIHLIMESLVKKKQKGAILELKRRHLKNTIFCTYTPYPAMKIRRISASSAQETRNDQFPIRRIHYNQYAVCTAVHQSKIRI